MKRSVPKTVHNAEEALRLSKKQEIGQDLGDEHHFDTTACYDVIPKVQEGYGIDGFIPNWQGLDKQL
jgi:hypothetical protein